MIYLTGSSSQVTREAQHPRLGLLVAPKPEYRDQIKMYPTFGVDNGMYGLASHHQEHTFDTAAYYRWVASIPRTALFVTAPDILHFHDGIPIGDAAATLDTFPTHTQAIRVLGHKVALVGQDGLEDHTIPWELMDALFIGGSTPWKLGSAALAIVLEAKKRGKLVHMGRVNSYKRLQYAEEIGCDTVDGTYLRFGPRVNFPKLMRWLA